jgi:hypothetical protein
VLQQKNKKKNNNVSGSERLAFGTDSHRPSFAKFDSSDHHSQEIPNSSRTTKVWDYFQAFLVIRILVISFTFVQSAVLTMSQFPSQNGRTPHCSYHLWSA